jgi:hypothetical protein
MNEELINERGIQLVKELVLDLFERQLIFNPCQVALSVYFPEQNNGKYLIFSTDAFPILNFLHPLLHLEDYNDSYKKAFKKDLEKLTNASKLFPDLKNAYFEKTDFSDTSRLISNSYDILRKVIFEGPLLMGEFFKICLASELSQESDSLTFKGILSNQQQKSELWDFGCNFEKALFLGGICTHYSCTFFNFNDIDNEQILCISLFCKPHNFLAVEGSVINLLKSKSDILLLKEIANDFKKGSNAETYKISPWRVNLDQFQIYLDKQKKQRAQNSGKPALSQTINYLEKIIQKMSELSKDEERDNNLETLLLIDNFIKNDSTVIGTPQWLRKLETLHDSFL